MGPEGARGQDGKKCVHTMVRCHLSKCLLETMSNLMQRSTNWCWTLNNYTAQEVSFLEDALTMDGTIFSFLIWGHEVGSAEETPHLQGYLELRSRKTLRSLKKWFGDSHTTMTRIHLEIRRGPQKAAIEYCKKEGSYRQFGTPKKQGSRSDLDNVRAMIQDGHSDILIADAHFGDWIRYGPALQRYRNLIRPSGVVNYELDSFEFEDFDVDWTKSVIMWGEPGVGKTEYAKAKLGEGFLMVSHMDRLKDFDKTRHSGILFDDMNFKHLHREAQIHLIDIENDRDIHVRYGMAHIPRGTKKIFTTNVINGDVFNLGDGAIARRLDVHHVGIFN